MIDDGDEEAVGSDDGDNEVTRDSQGEEEIAPQADDTVDEGTRETFADEPNEEAEEPNQAVEESKEEEEEGETDMSTTTSPGPLQQAQQVSMSISSSLSLNDSPPAPKSDDDNNNNVSTPPSTEPRQPPHAQPQSQQSVQLKPPPQSQAVAQAPKMKVPSPPKPRRQPIVHHKIPEGIKQAIATSGVKSGIIMSPSGGYYPYNLAPSTSASSASGSGDVDSVLGIQSSAKYQKKLGGSSSSTGDAAVTATVGESTPATSDQIFAKKRGPTPPSLPPPPPSKSSSSSSSSSKIPQPQHPTATVTPMPPMEEAKEEISSVLHAPIDNGASSAFVETPQRSVRSSLQSTNGTGGTPGRQYLSQPTEDITTPTTSSRRRQQQQPYNHQFLQPPPHPQHRLLSGQQHPLFQITSPTTSPPPTPPRRTTATSTATGRSFHSIQNMRKLQNLFLRIEQQRHMHQLSYIYYSALHRWLIFLPAVILTLVSGITALVFEADIFINASGINEDTINVYVGLGIGVTAISSVLLQCIARQYNYNVRSQLHHITATMLQQQSEEILLLASTMTSPSRRRSSSSSSNAGTTISDDYILRTSDRVQQALQICMNKSTIPYALQTTFAIMSDRMMILVNQHLTLMSKSRNSYGNQGRGEGGERQEEGKNGGEVVLSQGRNGQQQSHDQNQTEEQRHHRHHVNDVIVSTMKLYASAYNELSIEIVHYWLWPFQFPSNPRLLTETAIQSLQQSIISRFHRRRKTCSNAITDCTKQNCLYFGCGSCYLCCCCCCHAVSYNDDEYSIMIHDQTLLDSMNLITTTMMETPIGSNGNYQNGTVDDNIDSRNYGTHIL